MSWQPGPIDPPEGKIHIVWVTTIDGLHYGGRWEFDNTEQFKLEVDLVADYIDKTLKDIAEKKEDKDE